MTCPSCKLENPATALRCDCGYAFGPTAKTDPSLSLYLHSIDSSIRTIKWIIIAWAVLTVIGALILPARH